MKNKVFVVIAVVLCIVSVLLMLYPTASQLINKAFDKNSIIQYNNQVSALSDTEKEELLTIARSYNYNLSNVVSVADAFSPDAFVVDEKYENILRISKDSPMGTVSIPKIDCDLPIYHGISEDILDKGAVHMANTSFPIGGESTHAVVSAHTAYPGKEFFNRLTELKEGDYFYITVLGDTLAYKICRIDVVLPSDSRLLRVENGQDLCTLVTCTPYSVNTHRLLVRGQRDEAEEQRLLSADEDVLHNNDKNNTVLYIVIAGAVVFIGFFVIVLIRRKRKENSDDKEN